MKFESHQLYGGAMVADIPDNFYDVSDLRQVPDTQEVFQEREGIHNVIVDILEYVDLLKNPIEAARYHLEDYVDDDGDLNIWKIDDITLPHLTEDAAAVSMLATTAPKDGKSTAIFLVLVRLEKHTTDLVITINMHGVSTGDAKDYDALFSESSDIAFKNGKDITQQFIHTFKIGDYNLFHPDEA